MCITWYDADSTIYTKLNLNPVFQLWYNQNINTQHLPDHYAMP